MSFKNFGKIVKFSCILIPTTSLIISVCISTMDDISIYISENNGTL